MKRLKEAAISGKQTQYVATNPNIFNNRCRRLPVYPAGPNGKPA
jgi:hypothetical protein